MRTVEEFELEVRQDAEVQSISAAWDSYTLLRVWTEAGRKWMWTLIISAVVDDSKKVFTRRFVMARHGDELPVTCNYMGSARCTDSGPLYYLFELPPYADRPPRPEAPAVKEEGSLL